MTQSSPVRPGDILAGKYRVERVLGVGGMGVVVAATHLALDEKVALKFLLPHTAQNGEVVARFLREARAAAKIRSEHIARVSDVGTLENGAPYLVMEYLDGQDLAARLERGGPLPVQQAIDCLLQACEALAEAHIIGIVHRDLKPANLFLTRRADGTPSVKVLDFGISKMASDEGVLALTKTTAGMMGSPLYMSPEQLQSAKDVDARTDVWALGVILYELLTGDRPFMAETLPQLVVQIMNATPRPIRELRAEIPDGLAGAIEHAMQRDRAQRLPDVVAFAAAIAPFGGVRATDSAQRVARVFESKGIRPSLVTPLPVRGLASSGPMMQMTTGGLGSVSAGSAAPALTTRPARSKRLPLAIGAALLLLAGGAVAVISISRGSTPKPLGTSHGEVEKSDPKPTSEQMPRPTATSATPDEVATVTESSANSAPPSATAKTPAAVSVTTKASTTSPTTKASTKPSTSATGSASAPKTPKSASTDIQIE